MYYEVYIDTLFCIQLVMNLYLLFLINRSLGGTATRFRLVGGAAMGSVGYCLLFIMPIQSVFVKTVLVGVASHFLMLQWVFRPVTMRGFFRIAEEALKLLFLFGGVFLLLSRIGGVGRLIHSFPGILSVGAVVTAIAVSVIDRSRQKANKLCRVALFQEDKSVVLEALVDTGNSLTEPISKSPVSVMDREAFEALFAQEKRELFRAIPYRSVGCERGIMKGYKIERLVYESEGIKRECCGVWIAISEKKVSTSGTYQMLLHPALSESGENIKKGKNRRPKYDCQASKDTV